MFYQKLVNLEGNFIPVLVSLKKRGKKGTLSWLYAAEHFLKFCSRGM